MPSVPGQPAEGREQGGVDLLGDVRLPAEAQPGEEASGGVQVVLHLSRARPSKSRRGDAKTTRLTGAAPRARVARMHVEAVAPAPKRLDGADSVLLSSPEENGGSPSARECLTRRSCTRTTPRRRTSADGQARAATGAPPPSSSSAMLLTARARACSQTTSGPCRGRRGIEQWPPCSPRSSGIRHRQASRAGPPSRLLPASTRASTSSVESSSHSAAPTSGDRGPSSPRD